MADELRRRLHSGSGFREQTISQPYCLFLRNCIFENPTIQSIWEAIKARLPIGVEFSFIENANIKWNLTDEALAYLSKAWTQFVMDLAQSCIVFGFAICTYVENPYGTKGINYKIPYVIQLHDEHVIVKIDSNAFNRHRYLVTVYGKKLSDKKIFVFTFKDVPDEMGKVRSPVSTLAEAFKDLEFARRFEAQLMFQHTNARFIVTRTPKSKMDELEQQKTMQLNQQEHIIAAVRESSGPSELGGGSHMMELSGFQKAEYEVGALMTNMFNTGQYGPLWQKRQKISQGATLDRMSRLGWENVYGACPAVSGFQGLHEKISDSFQTTYTLEDGYNAVQVRPSPLTLTREQAELRFNRHASAVLQVPEVIWNSIQEASKHQGDNLLEQCHALASTDRMIAMFEKWLKEMFAGMHAEEFTKFSLTRSKKKQGGARVFMGPDGFGYEEAIKLKVKFKFPPKPSVRDAITAPEPPKPEEKKDEDMEDATDTPSDTKKRKASEISSSASSDKPASSAGKSSKPSKPND